MRKKIPSRKSINHRITKEEVFWGIIIVGTLLLVLLISTAFTLLNDVLFLPGAMLTTGTVVSCQTEYIPRGGSYCEATIRFDTQSGQQITFYSSNGHFELGDTVPITYHPNNPEDARTGTLRSDLAFSGIVLGLLLMELGIYWYWKRCKIREYIQKHKGQTPKSKWSNKKRNKRIRYLGRKVKA